MSVLVSALAVVGMLGAGQSSAGVEEVLVPVILKDLNPGPGGSGPSRFTQVGGSVLFAATDPASGAELRRTDGTAAGTALVKDINPGAGGSLSNSRFAMLGGTLYFGANDNVNGTELWKSDGTAAGTVLVKDLNPGSSSSNAGNFIVAGTTMFFTATDGTAGTELWTTNGTAEGTFMVRDINPGTASNFGTTPPAMTAVGNTLYFPASDGTAAGGHGDELWKSDGTEAGTVLVKDIRPGIFGSGINSFSFATLGTGVIFTANDGSPAGSELWRSDGTEAGTVLVKDLFTGTGNSSSPSNTTVVNGVAYFSANTGIGAGGMGVELYKSDGTTAGTVLLKDIVPGGNGSFPNNFTGLGTDVLFSADASGSGNNELFKTDGTAAGTVVLKDINPGPNGSSPANFAVVGSTVYFSASNGTTAGSHGTELWKTDGTSAGTVMTLDLNPGTANSSPTSITPGLGTAFFAATSANTGNEPYRLRTNAAPTAAADAFATRVNSPHTFPAPGVLDNDTDPDGDTLTAALPVRTVSDGVRTAGSTTVTSATAAFTADDLNAFISGTGIPAGSRIVAVTDASTVTISNAATTTGSNTALTITRQAANGTVALNTDGSFTYTPNTGFSGSDTFTYAASDGGGGIATGTVTMTVAGTNTAPVANADAHAANEDTQLSVAAPGVLANDTDADADTLTARLTGRTITDAATDFPNIVMSNTANFTPLDVGAAISGPGLQAGARIASVTSSTRVTLTNNIVFPPLTGVTMTITPQPGARTATAHGDATLNPDGSFTYNPAFNYTGPDTFTYIADDGYGLTATATVTITVGAVNDAPVAGADTYTTNATDPPLVVAAPGVLANDTDAEGDALTASSPSTPANGTVTLNADGSFTYTPSGTFAGVDTFTYTVSDVNGATATGTVSINVRSANSVDSVKGSACAYYTNVSLFGGPAALRGCGQNAAQPATAASPAVNLPPMGSATAITAVDSDGARAEYGPATIFGGRWPEDVAQAQPSGPLAASTQGTAAGGTVTSSADISLHPTPIPVTCYGTFTPPCTAPGGFGPWPVEGDSAHVECTASKTGVSGFTTFSNAQVALATDADGNPTVFENVPDSPPVNYTRSGVISNVGDVFTVVYNQHVINSDGSLTVNAAHMYLMGPTAVGDMVKGSVTCGTTPSPLTPVTDTVAPTCSTAIIKTVSPTNPAPREPREELVGVLDSGKPEVRVVTDGVTTNGSTTITSATAAFATADVGGTITGPGIPAGARIATRTNATTVVMTQAATATATGVRLEITRQAGGVQMITNVQSTNATVAVPTFTPGTTGPVALTATRINAAQPMYWSFDATDGAGNVTHCSGAMAAPVAEDDSYTTTEDTPLAVTAPGVLGNDTAATAGTFTAGSASTPANGTVTLNPNGSFTYTPNAGFNGSDSFTYTASDPSGGTDTATVTITITAVNDAPVAADDAYTTAEDTPLTVNAPGVLGNDTDAEGDPLTAGSAGTPANGTVTLNTDGSFTYTPTPNFNGTDTFTYKANDGTTDSNTATVSITVSGVADTPVAVDDEYTTAFGTPLTVAAPGVLGNDTDAEGDPLTAGSASTPANGTVALSADGSFTYTPNAGFNGTDTFTYDVSDGQGGSDTATVTITVAANQAPVAADDTASTQEDTPLTVTFPGVLGNDTDAEGHALTAGSASTPANGTVTLNADGSYTYTPNANFSGTDTFTYDVSDGHGGTDTATVTITVSGVADAPVAVDDSYTTAFGTPLTVSVPGVLGNDTDVDGDTLTAGSASTPANGTVTLSADGSFTYTPNAGFNGTDTFTYTVSDGNGGTDTATVTITIAANNAPVATDDPYTTDEDTPLTIAAPGVLGNDTDAEGDTLTAGSASTPANGTVTLDPDGSFTYTPNAGFNGTDAFTYVVSDGNDDTDTGTVTITVNSVNDAPVATDDAYNGVEETPLTIAAPGVLGNDTDGDGGTLTVSSASDPAHGSVVVNPDGSFTYTPDANFNGTDTFTYDVSDGQEGTDTGLVTITVEPGPAPPPDFDGDGDTDVSVYRPSAGVWFVRGGTPEATGFGVEGDIAVPADYDGDGNDDIAVFRPFWGLWHIHGGATTHFGAQGDIPVPGDYDGDGDDDIAVYRPSNGAWLVSGQPTGFWGTSGDVPVPGDYDGDGDDDIAVFRPSTGVWFVYGSPAVAFGTNGDIPVPGDYDGDGRTDIAVFRPSNGVWFVDGSAGTDTIQAYGTTGDIPVPGDYDDDGITDIGVFRPSSGVWFIDTSGGSETVVAYGTNGDQPLSLPAAIRELSF